MLTKNSRLIKDEDFNNVFKYGRSSYDNVVGVRALVSQRNNNRFGILVSNKVSKKAVERSKIKRQVREIIKLNLVRMKPSHDVVIICLPNILNKTYQEIKCSFRQHLIKLGLFKK